MHSFSFLSKQLLTVSLCCFTLQLAHALEEPSSLSSQESLRVKRIVQYWKDGDYFLAKKQILEFLGEYKESPVQDRLLTMLGDLYFQEKKYADAFDSYNKLSSEEFQEQVLLKKLKCQLSLNQLAAVEQKALEALSSEKAPSEENALQLHLILSEAFFKESKLKEALPHLEELYNQPAYKDSVRTSLAICYQSIQDYPKAAALFRVVAQKEPEKREELLYQIGLCETFFNKEAALSSFSAAAECNGEKKSDALFHQFTLLYELGRHQEVVEKGKLWMESFSSQSQPEAQFYFAESLLGIKDYAQAIEAFQQFAASQREPSSLLKTALIHLMVCAKETHNPALSEESLASLASFFPNAPEHLQAILINADLQKKAGNITLTEEEFKKLLQLSSSAEEGEKSLFNYGLLLVDEKRWKESQQLFSFFLNTYPESSFSKPSWRLLLNSSLQELKSRPEDEVLKERFVQDLAAVFSQNNILTSEEAPQYHFLFVKHLYELKRQEQCLQNAESFLAAYPYESNAPDVHLVAALCYEELLQDSEKAIDHFESALSLFPAHRDGRLIYIHLFNNYLAYANKNTEKKDLFEAKAADALFEAFINRQASISSDNQVWLAGYLYNQAEATRAPLAQHKALLIHEKILPSSLSAEQLALFEQEAYQYSSLLSMKADTPNRILFLERITQEMERHPQLNWKERPRFLYELALSYVAVNEEEKALAIFNQLLQQETSPQLSAGSLLNKTRILYARLAPEDKVEGSAPLTDILNNLKDLQINKMAASEPLHLEAALEYVDIRTSLAASDEALDKKLFFLKRMQEDFSSSDEEETQRYRQAMTSLPEKENLYRAYMDYVQTEITALEAQKSQSAGEENSSAAKQEEFKALFTQLRSTKGITPFLQTKINNLETKSSSEHQIQP